MENWFSKLYECFQGDPWGFTAIIFAFYCADSLYFCFRGTCSAIQCKNNLSQLGKLFVQLSRTNKRA